MKYIMVTHWNNHWDNLYNNKALFTKTMYRGSMNDEKLIENTETIFIKRCKETKKVEKCWIGKVYNFKEDVYRNLEAVYFNVTIDRELDCPIDCVNLAEGWYYENALVEDKITRFPKNVKKEPELILPQHVNIGWLLKNIPLAWLLTYTGFILMLGVAVAGIPSVKKMLKIIPGYKIDMVFPVETTKHIEIEISKLIESHNTRLSQLQEKLLYEEQLGGDHTLLNTYQMYHQKAAQRIKESIKEENQNFHNELKSMKSILE